MAKKLDPVIADVLKKYGVGHEACWDCHGTWVVYHKFLEQIAAKALIKFDPPLILEADGVKKCAAICVTGSMLDRSEWSIGEAAPANNKNAYPFAMAEKRGKDRVILKLIGLHGLAYSEEEADELKYAGADLTHESDQRMANNIDAYAKKVGETVDEIDGLPRNEQEWKDWGVTFKTVVDSCTTAGQIEACEKGAKGTLDALLKASPSYHANIMDHVQGRREILETPTGNTVLGAS